MQKSEEKLENQNSREFSAEAAFADYDDIPDFTPTAENNEEEEFKIQEAPALPWNSAVCCGHVDTCYPPLDHVELPAKKTCK